MIETLKRLKERLMPDDKEKKDAGKPAAPKTDRELLHELARKVEMLNRGQHWPES